MAGDLLRQSRNNLGGLGETLAWHEQYFKNAPGKYMLPERRRLQAIADAEPKATDYIPAAMKDQIVAHTALLGPRKSDEITFKVPTEPGDYPFLCTFPAHFQVGMKGVLTVK